MQFGYHLARWGFNKVSRHLPSILEQVVQSGYRAIECHDVDILPFLQNPKGFRDLLNNYDIKLVALYCPEQFVGKTFFDELIVKYYFKEVDRLEKFAKFANAVECEKILVGGSVGKRTVYREQDYATMANTLNRMGKMCREYGVTLDYHPHLDTIVENDTQVAKMCKLTDPDLVGVALETGHLFVRNVDIPAFIRRFADRIRHVHMKDVRDDKFVELGTGHVDLVDMIKTLIHVGYEDWVVVEEEVNSLEFPWSGTTSRTPLESAISSRKYLEWLCM